MDEQQLTVWVWKSPFGWVARIAEGPLERPAETPAEATRAT